MDGSPSLALFNDLQQSSAEKYDSQKSTILCDLHHPKESPTKSLIEMEHAVVTGLGHLQSIDPSSPNFNEGCTSLIDLVLKFNNSSMTSNQLTIFIANLTEVWMGHKELLPILLTYLQSLLFSLQTHSPTYLNSYEYRLNALRCCCQVTHRVILYIGNEVTDSLLFQSSLSVYNGHFISHITTTIGGAFSLLAYRLYVLHTLLPCHIHCLHSLYKTTNNNQKPIAKHISDSLLAIILISIRLREDYHRMLAEDSIVSNIASSKYKHTPTYRGDRTKKKGRSYRWYIDEESLEYRQLVQRRREKRDGDTKRGEEKEEESEGESDSESRKRLRGREGQVLYWNDAVMKHSNIDIKENIISGDDHALSYNNLLLAYENDLPSLFLHTVSTLMNDMDIKTKLCIVKDLLHNMKKFVCSPLIKQRDKEKKQQKESTHKLFRDRYNVLLALLLLVCSSRDGNLLETALKYIFKHMEAYVSSLTANSNHNSKNSKKTLLFSLHNNLFTFLLSYSSSLLLPPSIALHYYNIYVVLYIEHWHNLSLHANIHKEYREALVAILFHRIYDTQNRLVDEAMNVNLLVRDHLTTLIDSLDPAHVILLYVYILPTLGIPLDLAKLHTYHEINEEGFKALRYTNQTSINQRYNDLYAAVHCNLHLSLQMLLTPWPIPSTLPPILIPDEKALLSSLYSIYKEAILPLLTSYTYCHSNVLQVDTNIYNLTLTLLPTDVYLIIISYLPFKRYEETIWSRVYKQTFKSMLFVDDMHRVECGGVSKKGTICNVCIDRRLAELEGYDSLREKEDECFNKKKSSKVEANKYCCHSTCSNHAWRLLLKERVQELRNLRKQESKRKQSRGTHRTCPVIGCDIIILCQGNHRIAMDKHLQEHRQI